MIIESKDAYELALDQNSSWFAREKSFSQSVVRFRLGETEWNTTTLQQKKNRHINVGEWERWRNDNQD